MNTPSPEQLAREIAKHPHESFYLIDESVLKARVELFQRVFFPGHPKRHIAFAVKANPDLVPMLHRFGLSDFDCASGPEANFVRKETHSEVWTSFNNPCAMAPPHIIQAIHSGVRYFTIDNPGDLDVLIPAATELIKPEDLQIAIRLATETRHSGINLSDKVGCDLERSHQLAKLIRGSRAQLGLAIHVGSQTTDPQVFAHEIDRMAQHARELGDIRHLNLGGGIPAPEQDGDVERDLSNIVQISRQQLGELISDDIDLILEPGRSMVADAVTLVVPILRVLRRLNKPEIRILDGVFTSFGDASIHDWKYPLLLIDEKGQSIDSPKSRFLVQGQTCDSGDTLGQVELPDELHQYEGQSALGKRYLISPNAGAYLRSTHRKFQMISPHKNRFLPPEN